MSKTRFNGEGTIRKRKDGRYEVRVSGGVDYRTGEQIRISRYAKTEAEAIQLLHQLSLSVGNGNRYQNNSITLGEWLNLWLDVYMRNNLRQSTLASYETYIKRHYMPILGGLRLKDLTPQRLQQFYNYKIEFEKLSPKSISNMNLCLHKALEQAMKEGLIPTNPATALNLPRASRPEIEILTRDEQAALVRASRQHRYGAFVQLVLMTGLRLGELLGLKWEDIDTRTSMLHVRRSLNRVQIPNLPDGFQGPKTEILLQPPKTQNSIRTIPLLSPIMQDLLQWRSIQETDRALAGSAYCESGMVVTNPEGGYIEPRTFSDYYHQMLRMAGLHHFTFHALRHTFASRAMEQGMDEKTVSMLLGHYSVAFTMDTYAHVLEEHKWEGMHLMEGLCAIDCTAPPQPLYPIVMTPTPEGGYNVTAPDFPQLYLHAQSMEEGLNGIGNEMKHYLRSFPVLPSQTSITTIVPQPGQYVMQIPL